MKVSPAVPTDNFAVVLNANAGRVTPRLVDELKELVPEGQLFLTKSQFHAKDVIRTCVKEKRAVVFAGGGDGTIVDTINNIYDHRKENKQLPAVAALRLGTGNALATWLDAPNPAKALQNWREGQTHRQVSMRMVQAEETLFPFAGLGIDAAILNDYYRWKRYSKDTWFEPLGKGITGYLLAGHLKTMPNYIQRPKTRVRIINLGQNAYRIGPNGEESGKGIGYGEVIYEGNCTMVGCANTPYYGYAIKMFPFASQKANRFQVRVIDMSALQMTTNLWPAWNGKLRHPDIHDFYADRVRVVFKDAMPYQLGGEAAGYRKEMTFSLSEQAISMIGQG